MPAPRKGTFKFWRPLLLQNTTREEADSMTQLARDRDSASPRAEDEHEPFHLEKAPLSDSEIERKTNLSPVDSSSPVSLGGRREQRERASILSLRLET